MSIQPAARPRPACKCCRAGAPLPRASCKRAAVLPYYRTTVLRMSASGLYALHAAQASTSLLMAHRYLLACYETCVDENTCDEEETGGAADGAAADGAATDAAGGTADAAESARRLLRTRSLVCFMDAVTAARRASQQSVEEDPSKPRTRQR